MFGGAMCRLGEADFGEIRHAGGVSPAWPIGYDVFAPYYTQAEYLYHVHGQRGSDPTEPPADQPYPFGPLMHEPRIAQLKADLEKLGYHPFPLPLVPSHQGAREMRYITRFAPTSLMPPPYGGGKATLPG